MEQLRALIEAAGIDEWGVCAFSEVLPLRPVGAANRLPEAPAGMILLLFGYYIGEYTNRNISRYAIPDDYHTVVRGRLEELAARLEEAFAGERFVPFVDSSPIAEVRAAVRAGLGEIGKNGQLLSGRYGSYCFIGELVTTLALTGSPGAAKGLCTGCNACIRACPTGALTEGGFDPALCRSQITQKKGALSVWEREQIRAGGMAWGCDCCTEACPVNRRAQPSRLEEFYNAPVAVLTAEHLQTLCKSKAYGWRGAGVLRRNLEIL